VASSAINRGAGTPSIAIIGTGFGGLGMGHYLKKAGIDSFEMFEKASAVGGVWRDNTYPGAACDVASHLYSFSFEPHYPWSRRYGPQPEIRDYLDGIADKYDLRRHIRFGREVEGADYDEARGLWRIRFTDGATHEAQVLITAVGQLNRPQIPALRGLESFAGRAFHSARWEHDYDFTGKRVAVIGTGPSAVQFVPAIAAQAAAVHVFQRSTSWTLPKFDGTYTAIERWLLTNLPFLHTLDRWRIYWWYEFLSSALQNGSWIGRLSRPLLRFAARTLMKSQVTDPSLRARLAPDTPLGCKRILLSNEWLPALARANVEVVTEPALEVGEDTIRAGDGRERKIDALVFGTGFSATQFLAPMDFRGVGGASLRERWAHGAQGYLGVAVTGFPNLFMLYGPNSNLGAGSIIYMLERQQRYVTRWITEMTRRRLASIDVAPEAQEAFNAEMVRRSSGSAYTGGCTSWYLVEGRNTNNWVGYMSEYGRRLRRPVLAHFRVRKHGDPTLGLA
jgi:cation diffusion facilitator CzcD-associated flavoprotein CzcO